jgi:cytochrome c
MVKALILALSASCLAGGVALAAGGDPAAGEATFKVCAACHAIGPGATNRVGPVLNGLFGRAAGTAPGYRYSPAMKKSGITWDESTFAKFIKNPRGVVPGTKMSYAGLQDDAAIANVTAYIESFNADGSKK